MRLSWFKPFTMNNASEPFLRYVLELAYGKKGRVKHMLEKANMDVRPRRGNACAGCDGGDNYRDAAPVARFRLARRRGRFTR